MEICNSINLLKESWDKRDKKSKVEFRRIVCVKCDWPSEKVFYNKLTGVTPISILETDMIRKLDKQIS